MKNEFNEFMGDTNNKMPRSVEQIVKDSIIAKLSPTYKFVFFKVSIIQAFCGILLIAACPQLGVSFFEHSWLMNVFMNFGHHVCTFLCGSLFLSLGVLGNWMLLSREEWKLYYQEAFKFQFSILVTSICFLLIFGASGQYILFLLWSIGGLLTSLSLIKWVFKGAVPNSLAA